MVEKVKYSKRFYNKETGDHELSKRKIQSRDFGATRMTLQELESGMKRALKRGSKASKEKAEMYLAQAKAYEARIEWYTT